MTNPEMVRCPTCNGHGEIVFTGKGSTFDTWWQFYPRKEGKGDAERAHKDALVKIRADKCLTKSGSSDFLVEKCKEYSIAKAGQDKKFIPLPATWLRGKRWDDDPAMWVDEKSVVSDRQFEMARRQAEEQAKQTEEWRKDAQPMKDLAAQYRREKGLE